MRPKPFSRTIIPVLFIATFVFTGVMTLMLDMNGNGNGENDLQNDIDGGNGNQFNGGQPSPSIGVTDATVGNVTYNNYNPEYRLVKYERIYSFPNAYGVNMLTDIVDEMEFMTDGYGGNVDVFLLKNGTILLFNTTFGYSAPVFRDGANYTFWFKDDLGVSNCEIEQFLAVGTDIYVFYENLTSNEIFISRYGLNNTDFFFLPITNITIHNPVNVTASSLVIYDVLSNSAITGFCGYYDNGTNDVPFFYNVNADLSGIVTDCLALNSSSTFHQSFGTAIFKILDGVGGYTTLATNEKVVNFQYPPYGTYIFFEIPLQDTIDYHVDAVDFAKLAITPLTSISTFHSYSRYVFFYVVYRLTPTFIFKSYSIECILNSSAIFPGFVRIAYNRGDIPSMETEVIGYDNFFTAITDIGSGMIFNQFDGNLVDHDRYTIVTTQPILNFFDLFIPIDVERVLGGVNGQGDIIRCVFGSGLSLWVAQFSSSSINMFSIGNNRIDFGLVDRAYVTHEAGTKYFRYKLSGTITRNATNASEIVEIGIKPMYICTYPTVQLAGDTSAPFYTSKGETILMSNLILSNRIIGFPVIQVQNFIGFGNRYIDFTLEFDSEYLVGTSFFGDFYNLLDIQVNFVIYEKYQNGTYMQTYLNTWDRTLRYFVTTWDYDLKTTVVLEDSHTLDELHIFVGGQEFDPYAVVFDLPFMSVLATDKFTLEVLYNSSSVLFADPVVLNIPSKYEFYLAYFSTLDKFGFSFDLVSTFVNGTEVTSEFVRVLSENAEIVVRDFAGETLKNTTINRFVNGTYIKIGLDIAQVIISNQYTNKTIDFYLTKGGTTIYYQLPSSTSFILRLALGDYSYKIEDANTGEVLFDDNVTIGAAITLSFGFADVVIPVLPPQGYTFLDTIISAVVFAIIVFIIMLAYNSAYFKKIERGFVTVKKKP